MREVAGCIVDRMRDLIVMCVYVLLWGWFVVRRVIKDIGDVEDTNLASSVDHVRRRGFLNYFGLQRFGNGVPTFRTGQAFLRGEWTKALGMILAPRPVEIGLSKEAREYLVRTGDIKGCLDKLPRAFNIERGILVALLQPGGNQTVPAIQKIPRNTRRLYVHAYQSYVWNHMASVRVQEFSREGVIVGDLVVKHEAQLTKKPDSRIDDVEVHVVTEDDIARGTYEFTDVVLPMPGTAMRYPSNTIGKRYMDFMAQDGITPESFESSIIPDFRLPGGYRYVIKKPWDVSWKTVRHATVDDKLTLDDIDALNDKKDEDKDVKNGLEDVKNGLEDTDVASAEGPIRSLIVSFSLDSSTYATMFLRELMKPHPSGRLDGSGPEKRV